MYCLHVLLCIFQPGNFTGWGSNGVNNEGIYNVSLYGNTVK